MLKINNDPVEEKSLLVERVGSSGLFRKSPRLRDFFLYVADCTLEGRLADVREQVIAERVFRRKLELVGGQDSIVRAEARNLRKRLEIYFATEGLGEPVTISMPKGGYALSFEPRVKDETAISPPLEQTEFLASGAIYTHPPPAHSAINRSRILTLLCIVLGALAASSSLLALHWREGEMELRKTLRVQGEILPFSALLKDGKDSLIVTSDTGLLQISSLAHRRITLDEYMARSYPEIPLTNPPDLIKNWNLYEFTDGREMSVAGLIARRYSSITQHFALRTGHQVELADFKDHSAILIGSAISNPWAQLYEDRLSFPTDLAADGRIVFMNRSPRSGESSHYPNADDIAHHRTYARIVFLPGTADTGPALLVAGTTAQSTQAAGEFVMDSQRMGSVLRSMGVNPMGAACAFEILIRVNNFVGGAIQPEVVAWRTKAVRE